MLTYAVTMKSVNITMFREFSCSRDMKYAFFSRTCFRDKKSKLHSSVLVWMDNIISYKVAILQLCFVAYKKLKVTMNV